ncbi:MAG: SpoIID/LytB domain-containing protein [Deltaproteobacteria bacterium]|nr:SpoIID/LytB domain-containing protein [Deltaproteobacteria bacterium]
MWLGWALALAVASEAPTAPATIDVVILSKHRPRALRVEGACRASKTRGRHVSNVRELRLRGKRVRACGPRRGRKKPRCIEAPKLVLQCRQDAVLRVPGLEPRRYGRGLKVRAYKGALRLIASVDRERYVAGVVESELRSAPREAAIAQSILARTFAMRAALTHRHDDAPLCDLTHCQVYAGSSSAAPSGELAAPQVLLDRRGHVAPIFFHSTCGGQTLSARAVWGTREAPDIVGVRDVDARGEAWCRKGSHFRWVQDVAEADLARALDELAGRPLDAPTLELESTSDTGERWVITDREGSIKASGEALHLQLSRRLGFSKVKSSAFVAQRAGGTFHLSGSGLGHRVGLCQVGALARAGAGQSAREILEAYFPRLSLVTLGAPP